jgi:RHS repeat-associated protein
LTEIVNGTTRVLGYSYDNRARLTDVTLAGTTVEHYTYDDNGNRLSSTLGGNTVTSTYDVQDRLTAMGATSYTYNARGALASKTDGSGTTSYTYDVLGHLTHVALPSASTLDYTYDALGRRVTRAVDNTIQRRYLYGSGDSPVALLDGNGTLLASYVYGRNGASPDLIISGGVTYRVVADQLGSPRLIVNTATGAVVQQLGFSTFGATTADTNPGFQPFGFTGGLADADTGLVHLGARDYDPTVGRFTSPDPLGAMGSGTNNYAYAGNDQVNFFDPSGLTSCRAGENSASCWNGSPMTGNDPAMVAYRDLWSHDPRAAEQAVESAQRMVAATARWYDKQLCLERILQEATWAQAQAMRDVKYAVLPVYKLVEGAVGITTGCFTGFQFFTEKALPIAVGMGAPEIGEPLAAAIGCASGMVTAGLGIEGLNEAVDQTMSEPF